VPRTSGDEYLTKPTFIMGHQTLAWINKAQNTLDMIRLCSYSEEYDKIEN